MQRIASRRWTTFARLFRPHSPLALQRVRDRPSPLPLLGEGPGGEGLRRDRCTWALTLAPPADAVASLTMTPRRVLYVRMLTCSATVAARRHAGKLPNHLPAAQRVAGRTGGHELHVGG